MKGILWATIIVIIPSFIIFYGSRRIRGTRTPASVGEVYGRKISFNEYRRSLYWVTSLAVMRYGRQFDEVAKFLNLEKEAWENIILLKYAELKGIRASDSELVSVVSSVPAFQKDGKFDNEIYRAVLREHFGVGPEYFEDGMRTEVSISKLRRSITNCVKLTQQELRQYYRFANEEVKVKYVLFKSCDFEKEVSITEKQIRDYFESHREEFRLPEKVKLEYVFFKPGDVKVEGALEKAEEEGEELLSLLEEGERSWDELKAEETDYLEKGSTGTVPPGCIDTAFSMEVGEVSDLIRAGEGFYVVKLVDRKESSLPENLQDAAERVEEKLRRIESSKLARSKAERCLHTLREKKDITAIARKYSMKVTDTDFFTRNGYIKELGVVPGFRRVAFSLSEDSPFDMVGIPLGFCVLRFGERKNIDEKKFSEEEDKLYRILLEGKRERIFRDWFWLLKERASFRITYTSSPQTDKF